MDPNEALRQWRESTKTSVRAKHRASLRGWLANGGFEPEWESLQERARFLSESVEKRTARIEREIEAERKRLARKNPADEDGTPWGWLLLGGIVAVMFFKPFSSAPASTSGTPAIEPTARPVTVGLTAEDHAAIRGVQDRLRAIGYQPGPSTGAIAAFQHDEHIVPADGVLNGLTALRLVAVHERKIRQVYAGQQAALQAQLDAESTFWEAFSLFRGL